VERVHRLAQALPPLPRVPLRLVAAVVVSTFLLGGGYLWLRDSSLVAVKRVDIIGVSSSEGPQVRQALEDAARGMTTMHLDRASLEGAVERFPSVAGLRIQTDFPHGVSIEVTERSPIAKIDLNGEQISVGAGGRLMRGVQAKGDLPVLHAVHIAGDKLTDETTLQSVSILAAAPRVLRKQVSKIWAGPKGQMLELRDGPTLFFGSADRPVAKWMATARVLAEPSAAGAVYLDVRVPERVAAGGLGTAPTQTLDPLAPAGTGQTVNPQPTAESTASLNP
jgi:cell division protein FtsQ